MPIKWPRKFAQEGAAVGRLLSGYSNLEIDLMNCVSIGRGGDLNIVLKRLFGRRGGGPRIDEAKKLGAIAYADLRLGGDFDRLISILRHCLKLRNQYAHFIWWDDGTGKLAFANLEDIAKQRKPVNDLGSLRAFHADTHLLAMQERYFEYAEQYLAWLNYEARFRQKLINKNMIAKPSLIAKPPVRLP